MTATTGATALERILERLREAGGDPPRPEVTDPFAQILLVQVAYLASDEKRLAAFRQLEARVGLTPERVLAAPEEALRAAAAAGGGTAVAERAARMRESAAMVVERWGGDLRRLFERPTGEALKALAELPMIGGPGAATIFLVAGAAAGLALDSNGLRVLLRLGYGTEGRRYEESYRSAVAAAEAEIPADVEARLSAHLLLRRHGRTLCRRAAPRCDLCPAAALCRFVTGQPVDDRGEPPRQRPE